ncbi:hypothetical protein [Nocardia brasiliensis]|uniref:hypothetical protein n=1 Tax=Nocardia brasiliensis TaxID=37326 RepID=UPI002454BCB1|nr:hypothetical protein [Nocardia brasiliensis]
MSMKSFTLYLLGRELLSLMWDNGTDDDDTLIEFGGSATYLTEHDAEEIDGISYSCGHCGEVLVSGLQRALTPLDEADLLTVHVCNFGGGSTPESTVSR